MPKMTIPEPGTIFTLTQPWTFPLYHERRNVELYDKLAQAGQTPPRVVEEGASKYASRWWHEYEEVSPKTEDETEAEYEDRRRYERGGLKKTEITLPKGTRLKVDRVYIKGDSDYNSLTFRVIGHPKLDLKKTPKSPRFWAKLFDVNNISCQFAEETVPR